MVMKEFTAHDLANAYPYELSNAFPQPKRHLVWHWYYLNPFFWIAMFFIAFLYLVFFGWMQDAFIEVKWEYE